MFLYYAPLWSVYLDAKKLFLELYNTNTGVSVSIAPVFESSLLLSVTPLAADPLGPFVCMEQVGQVGKAPVVD